MKIKIRLFVVLLTLAVSLGIRVISAQAGSLNAPSANELLTAVNTLRAVNGLPPLRTNGALTTAAQAQSNYQASVGTWSHSGPGNSSPTQRAGQNQ